MCLFTAVPIEQTFHVDSLTRSSVMIGTALSKSDMRKVQCTCVSRDEAVSAHILVTVLCVWTKF